jgi:hypothetical protein
MRFLPAADRHDFQARLGQTPGQGLAQTAGTHEANAQSRNIVWPSQQAAKGAHA